MNIEQVEMVSVDQLVPQTHTYRKLKELLDFNKISQSAQIKVSEIGANGFGKSRLIMCLLLQFMEDLSDRGVLNFQQFYVQTRKTLMHSYLDVQNLRKRT